MSLSPGQRLGPYEITAPLGAGGMGEVFRARDTKLDREVAIKVLPAEVARDEERLARFRREAHLLAALNHPNIAAIHGLDEADGKPFLVLELVPGEDLAQRLKRGPIPLDEALPLARQVAEALEEAHEKGIVHRDLKPANVKVTPDGKVKVLDFGLAKAWSGDAGPGSSPDLSQSPTLAHTGTAAGLILGTAAYMSPEQARGKAVDRRADIWAFGVVLFEMLTGKALFAGETVTDVLAAVVTREPDLDALPAATPPAVRQLLKRCLEKDPRRRLRDIGEARVLLEAPAAEARCPVPTHPSFPRLGGRGDRLPPPRGGRRFRLPRRARPVRGRGGRRARLAPDVPARLRAHRPLRPRRPDRRLRGGVGGRAGRRLHREARHPRVPLDGHEGRRRPRRLLGRRAPALPRPAVHDRVGEHRDPRADAARRGRPAGGPRGRAGGRLVPGRAGLCGGARHGGAAAARVPDGPRPLRDGRLDLERAHLPGRPERRVPRPP